MANSVLEALWLGRAVLASAIEGNRSVIDHGKAGLLFHDEAEFERGAAALVRDPELRSLWGDLTASSSSASIRPTVRSRDIGELSRADRSAGVTIPRESARSSIWQLTCSGDRVV